MKEPIIMFLIFPLVILTSLSVNACSSSHWDAFLQKPDQEGFVELKNSIVAHEQRCDPVAAPEQRHRTQLLNLLVTVIHQHFVQHCWCQDVGTAVN